MLIGSSRVLFGLAAIVLPAIVFAFAAITLVVTSWRNWFGLQKKPKQDDPAPDKNQKKK
jgi:hypothetical protein